MSLIPLSIFVSRAGFVCSALSLQQRHHAMGWCFASASTTMLEPMMIQVRQLGVQGKLIIIYQYIDALLLCKGCVESLYKFSVPFDGLPLLGIFWIVVIRQSHPQLWVGWTVYVNLAITIPPKKGTLDEQFGPGHFHEDGGCQMLAEVRSLGEVQEITFYQQTNLSGAVRLTG